MVVVLNLRAEIKIKHQPGSRLVPDFRCFFGSNLTDSWNGSGCGNKTKFSSGSGASSRPLYCTACRDSLHARCVEWKTFASLRSLAHQSRDVPGRFGGHFSEGWLAFGKWHPNPG